MKQKVLIIKTGHSETIDPDDANAVSLGDVLRTTVILHLFPPRDFEVTWVATRKSGPLLKNNPYIHRLLYVNAFTPSHLASQVWDIVVNFEKDYAVCDLVSHLGSENKYGYSLKNYDLYPYFGSGMALHYSQNPKAKRDKIESWSEVLYQMCGAEYEGQRYIFENYEREEPIFDVGFNYQIGAKFPEKSWHLDTWRILEYNLHKQLYSISWQPEATTLEDYFKWIQSCHVIVTNDSLGLHLALAMGKKTIALFGPTYASEVDDYAELIKISKETMDDITVSDVLKEVLRLV